MKSTMEQWEYELYTKKIVEGRIKLSGLYDRLAEDRDYGVNQGAYVALHEYIEEALDSVDEAFEILSILKPEEEAE
ncbi:Uncharacterised protein [Listeria ivanovii subsp. londoniensis]|uniref:Phage protein n=1 Tax=Listeria ivanovii TaxID=1638 RepID=A0AAX2DT85_LISIV|nr:MULTISPECIES: hypothetical protein [Listeria]EFR97183.1 hypothetical protein NT05LI_1502 [Listeria ivanovii FSL F6-596]EHR5554145.1 hypothetical protein [Listeria monocytogenes]MBC1747287.1 hypothetical protein [Listeria seeligeri]SDX37172.1 hypothetical protein SAMN05421782_1195 [Listeria ivanovii]VEH45963.1 Uncharacterised protein [Listeria ivanovii subsp. londoniensis]